MRPGQRVGNRHTVHVYTYINLISTCVHARMVAHHAIHNVATVYVHCTYGIYNPGGRTYGLRNSINNVRLAIEAHLYKI